MRVEVALNEFGGIRLEVAPLVLVPESVGVISALVEISRSSAICFDVSGRSRATSS
jgi:hypothetical protein